MVGALAFVGRGVRSFVPDDTSMRRRNRYGPVHVHRAGRRQGSVDRVGRTAADALYGEAIHGVACVSATSCAAASPTAILTSRDPAGGAAYWKVAKLSLPPDEYLNGVACASATMCVAYAATTTIQRPGPAPTRGRIFSSSDPMGGSRAWKPARLGQLPTYATCLPDSASWRPRKATS